MLLLLWALHWLSWENSNVVYRCFKDRRRICEWVPRKDGPNCVNLISFSALFIICSYRSLVKLGFWNYSDKDSTGILVSYLPALLSLSCILSSVFLRKINDCSVRWPEGTEKKGWNIYSAEVNGRTVIDFMRESISPQVFLKLIWVSCPLIHACFIVRSWILILLVTVTLPVTTAGKQRDGKSKQTAWLYLCAKAELFMWKYSQDHYDMELMALAHLWKIVSCIIVSKNAKYKAF